MGVNLTELFLDNEFKREIQDILSTINSPVGVCGLDNRLLAGSDNERSKGSYPILAGSETIGYVVGNGSGLAVSKFITTLVRKENAIESLSTEILDKYTELNFIYDLDDAIHSNTDVASITKKVLTDLKDIFNVDNLVLFRNNETTGKLEAISAVGKEYEKGFALTVKPGNIICDVYLSGRAEVINNTGEDRRYTQGAQRASSLMCAPLKSRGNTQGVLYLSSTAPASFTADNLKLLSIFTIHMAYSLESSFIFGKLQEMLYATATTLIQTMKVKSKTISEHCKRVSFICQLLGISMGLSLDKLIDLRIAALIHDIGKLEIDEKILMKNEEQLSKEEATLIMKHAQNSSKILENLEQFRANIEPGVRWHHERFDGSGYPDRLKGEGIPLIARIISVANEYDNMTNKLSMLPTEAIDRIKQGAGTLFDPDIVRAFHKLYVEDFIK